MKMLPVGLLVLLSTFSYAQRMKTSVEMPGDLTIALLVKTCHNATVDLIPYHTNSLVSSAMWIVERLNYLEKTAPLTLGLKVYEICEEIDFFKSIFDLYQAENNYLLTVISEDTLNEKMLNFCEVLDVRSSSIARCSKLLVKTTVEFLNAMGWVENVTVFGPDEFIMEEFSSHAVKQSVCVMDLVIYGSACPNVMNISTPIVYFGNKCNIEHFSTHQENNTNDMLKMIFVPLDGSVPADLPERSYVIIPPHFHTSLTYQMPENIIPTPLLFETANPMLATVKSLQMLLKNRCNDTNKLNALDCIKSTDIKQHPYRVMSLSTILEYLKIEPLKEHFVYDIYRVDNDSIAKNDFLRPFTKAFTYNLFNQSLTLIDQSLDVFVSNGTFRSDPDECINFLLNRELKYATGDGRYLRFKSESWIYAFISLSLLGILFCVSIFTFLLICICRRDILEGNPILTLALLLATIMLLSSVLPFILTNTKHNSNALCLAKSMAITLSYALVFSLLLSRSILLASASKEIGFMSHIAGPVQSFLCLFIFGVQAALNLQVIGRCVDVFQGSSVLYLMSYNAMLLLLLLCLSPLMYKCQRNYREGKYFTIAIILITIVWCIWIPLYGYVDEDWRELVLCFGIVGTSMVLLGALFIPRTYLMTIAAARDRITSTLPSLATGTSTLDIYRANTQPIYDCVNVAAINAATVATVPTQTMQRPDLYSCPTLPEDEDLDLRCETPPLSDKITRF